MRSQRAGLRDLIDWLIDYQIGAGQISRAGWTGLLQVAQSSAACCMCIDIDIVAWTSIPLLENTDPTAWISIKLSLHRYQYRCILASISISKVTWYRCWYRCTDLSVVSIPVWFGISTTTSTSISVCYDTDIRYDIVTDIVASTE